MKFVCDENFDNRILRGLLHLNPDLDVVRVQDLAIAGQDDLTVLAWAEQHKRILLTHDQRTMPPFAYQRLSAGQMIAGLIIVKDSLPIKLVIEEILIIAECSSADEWMNQVRFLPL